MFECASIGLLFAHHLIIRYVVKPKKDMQYRKMALTACESYAYTCERVLYLVFPCLLVNGFLSGYTYAGKLTSTRFGISWAVLRVLITVDTMRGAAIVKVETPKQTKETDKKNRHNIF